MYPLHYASLFPPFPRTNRVFVAMSFAKQFVNRWENVIKPAIGRLAKNGVKLEAHRVDVRVVSDSILTEILEGISTAHLVLADVTTMHVLDGTACRNSNVMYEIGLTQALRLPEEVVLFRSDRDPLLFDLLNVRVNYYEPDTDAKTASDTIVKAMLDASKEIDQRRSLAVQRAADAINGPCVEILLEALQHNGTITFVTDPWKAVIASRMLELGIMKFDCFKLSDEMIAKASAGELSNTQIPYEYSITPFGRAVHNLLIQRAGFTAPSVQEKLRELIIAYGLDKET